MWLAALAAVVLPIVAGGMVHYYLLLRTDAKRPFVAEAAGWLVTFAAAIPLFPAAWQGMEHATCVLAVLYAAFQVLLCVALQPVARRLARRRLRLRSDLPS